MRSESAGEQSGSDASLWLVLTVIAVGGLWLGCDAALWGKILTAGDRTAVVVEDAAFGVGNLLPLAAIGVVLGWWMYAKPSLLPEKVSAALGPFARLSRNRFYWNDLYFLLAVQPATSLSHRLVWLDEHLWERGRQAVRRGMARFAGESCEPLANGRWSVYMLTTVSSVVVLAWMLMWLKSSS